MSENEIKYEVLFKTVNIRIPRYFVIGIIALVVGASHLDNSCVKDDSIPFNQVLVGYGIVSIMFLIGTIILISIKRCCYVLDFLTHVIYYYIFLITDALLTIIMIISFFMGSVNCTNDLDFFILSILIILELVCELIIELTVFVTIWI